MTPDGGAEIPQRLHGVEQKSFEDVIWLGKKVHDLDRAIWQLQGRTHEVEIFSDYVYDQPQNPKVPQNLIRDCLLSANLQRGKRMNGPTRMFQDVSSTGKRLKN